MKIAAPLFLIASATAFAPAHVQQRRAFMPTPLAMADDEQPGALVPIKQETVEFTAGILGGTAGFLVGGPVLGAVGAAIANYISKMQGDAPDVVQNVSKTSIEIFNYLATLDKKYEFLNKAKSSLETSLDKLKKAGNVDPSTIEKVETALKTTTQKITEINDEYDLVGSGVTALGVLGDLVEKAVTFASEKNQEYNLSEKALGSIKGAVDKAKVAANEAKSSTSGSDMN
jgi:hypothetical protein